MAPFASQDVDKIVSGIAKRIAGVSRPIVAVDGRAGVGKGRLAILAASRLNAIHLDLDNYVGPGAPYLLGYIADLRFDAVRRDIDGAVGGVILSGTCMRDALYALGRDATVHVYVKCWNTFRDCWDDEETCDFVSINDVPADAPPLERELMEYHARWQPHRRAAVEWHDAGESLAARARRSKARLNDKVARPGRA